MIRALFKLLLVLLIALVAAVAVGSIFFPEKLAKLAADAERGAAGLKLKAVDVEGFHIVYLDGGHGEPLLLIHGFGADKDNWTRVARFLTPHYRVIALDLPGFGESSKPETAHYRIEDQVGYVHAFVQALGVQSPSLGGSSMGGFIAAEYAARYPDEVKSLWLVAPAGVATAQESELVQRLKAGGPNPLLARNTEEFDQIIHFVMADPPYIPGAIEKVLGARAAANHALHERIFKEIRDDSAPLEPQVKGLTTPTRILWGDQDRALHVSGAQILAGLMPKASVTIMPGIGHLPMLEQPRESATDYSSFRATLK
jgi:pimeloyl-ACP methyl ester carboxylesterase